MKTLFGMIITMTFMFAGTVQAGIPLMSMENCRDALYEGGGAHTLRDATAVCYERRDEAFVGCVQDRYQDSNQSHTFATAVSTCRTRVVDYLRVCQDHMSRVTGMDWGVAGRLCQGENTAALTNCIVDAKRLGFNIGRSVQLCQWTTERSVYLCTSRVIRENGYSNEQSLSQCYSEFNRGELNNQGLNLRQIERERQQEAARRAAEQRAAQQRAEQRAAEQRAEQREDQRRQDEARREQNNPYRPPAPPPPVRSQPQQNIPVIDKSQPVTPAPVVTKPTPVKQAPVKTEPVKVAPVKTEPTKPIGKPAKPVVAKPATPAKPAEVPVEEVPTPLPTADCKVTNSCDGGVIVDLPNL